MKARFAALGGALCDEPFPLEVPMFTLACEKWCDGDPASQRWPLAGTGRVLHQSFAKCRAKPAGAPSVIPALLLAVSMVSAEALALARFDLERGNDLFDPVGVHRQHHRFADVIGRIDRPGKGH